MAETVEIAVGEYSFTADVAGPPDGAPVLLLHGFPETRHMWRWQLDALGHQGYRAVAPDQRGYSAGARPNAVETYATEHLVADMLGLMDALGAPSFHLVGHDWGGQIAWLIAAGHADRVRSLAVLSRPHPAAFARAMREDAAQAERSRHHRAFREDDAVARMRAAGLKPLREALERQGVPATERRRRLYPDADAAGGHRRRHELVSRQRHHGGIDAAEVSLPTRSMCGAMRTPRGGARRAAELTADYVSGPYRFVPLEGCRPLPGRASVRSGFPNACWSTWADRPDTRRRFGFAAARGLS